MSHLFLGSQVLLSEGHRTSLGAFSPRQISPLSFPGGGFREVLCGDRHFVPCRIEPGQGRTMLVAGFIPLPPPPFSEMLRGGAGAVQQEPQPALVKHHSPLQVLCKPSQLTPCLSFPPHALTQLSASWGGH